MFPNFIVSVLVLWWPWKSVWLSDPGIPLSTSYMSVWKIRLVASINPIHSFCFKSMIMIYKITMMSSNIVDVRRLGWPWVASVLTKKRRISGWFVKEPTQSTLYYQAYQTSADLDWGTLVNLRDDSLRRVTSSSSEVTVIRKKFCTAMPFL